MPVNVVNDSGMKFACLAGRVPPRPLTGTFIVKATLAIEPGRAAMLVPPDDQLDPDGEKTLDDAPSAGSIYPGDFAPFKPATDVLLTGSAHAPHGEPVSQMLVTLRVEQWTKSLAVFGDRLWLPGAGSPELGAARPFSTMPLTWEHAFGGPSFALNPCGRGIEPVPVANGQRFRLAPNVEYPRHLVRSAQDRPQPASFAPILSSWSSRMRNLGSYDAKWLRERWPWLPDDFDWSFFNAAPQDQRFEGFLRGDERIVLEGLNPDHVRVQTALPSLRPRWFIRQDAAGQRLFEEIPLHLDTLFIDAEKMRIVLLWRGVAGIQSLKMREVTDHLLVSERLEEPDKGLPYFQSLLDRRKVEIAAEGFEVEPPDADGIFPLPDVPALDMSWADAFEQEMAKDVAHAERVMADMRSISAPVGEDISRHVGPLVMDAGASQTFADIVQAVESALVPMRAAGGQAAQMATQEWLPPGLKNDIEEMDQLGQKFAAGEEPDAGDSPWTRERVERHYNAGGSFEGQELDGLDLAGLNLRGATFAGASMATANLDAACLDEANLDGVVLEGASLNETRFDKGSLKGADLAKVQGARASFAGATLDDAVFASARLPGAVFRKATGVSCDFAGCDLTGADLRDATFVQSDFSQAKLLKLEAPGASLVSCDIGQASAANANMAGARVKDLRATGADLRRAVLCGVSGEETAWDEANLDGADLREADLPGALFDGASLRGAVLDRANLAKARLCDANLTGASVQEANLFRATLESAMLQGAVFVGANMYEVEFFQAVIEGARFDGANLKGTKLA